MLDHINTPHPMTIGSAPLCWIDFSDASSLEIISDHVATARDKSGGGNQFVQATVGDRPYFTTDGINGLSVSDYRNSEDLETSGNKSDLNPSYFDMFAVIKNGAAESDFIFTSLSTTGAYGWGVQISSSVLNFETHDSAPTYLSGAFPTGSTGIVNGVVFPSGANTGATLNINGVQASTNLNVNYALNTDNATVFGKLNGGLNFSGLIGEFLMFNLLETHQRKSINQYLVNKWKL